MFNAGRGLHGIPTVTSPLRRKQIVQQLLVDDLSDLADERLHQLLPGGSQNFQPGWKQDAIRNSAVRSKHLLNSSPPKKSHTITSARKLGLAKEVLCYNSIEQKILHQLQQSHTEMQLVQTLKDTIYPQLSLKSYLESKSDLSLLTVRHILRGYSTNDAKELDLSLRNALKTQQQKKTFLSVKKRKESGFDTDTVPKNPHSWLLPMEWED